jgi:hypothetical protein
MLIKDFGKFLWIKKIRKGFSGVSEVFKFYVRRRLQ